ncbi:hypothetical protein [Nocardioides sambongensis]|uniref:hypothetical protein n=1 Tax=Nocardioides sambongensis TaxID=2589074 RepID=UPI0015E8581A|nr:hypothetical protein [Nocardioides sambongensis]
MHEFVAPDREALASITAWIVERLSNPPEVTQQGLAHGRDPLPEIGREGLGSEAAWSHLRDAVLPTSFPTDHPRYLAFVGGAPTPVAVMADAALSAASVYGAANWRPAPWWPPNEPRSAGSAVSSAIRRRRTARSSAAARWPT